VTFGSRGKGAGGENEVGRLLAGWWSQVEPGVTFKRTPASGGWASGHARGDFQTSGDLVTTAKAFPWCVEVKRREGWAWAGLLKGTRSPVWTWWVQAQVQANEAGLAPMLWFRRNREPWTVMVRGFCALTRVLSAEAQPKHAWAFEQFLERRDIGFHPMLFDAEALLRVRPALLIACAERS
jgi:hypothetical protein